MKKRDEKYFEWFIQYGKEHKNDNNDAFTDIMAIVATCCVIAAIAAILF